MPSRFEDLERLSKMLDENKISQQEYEDLKADILSSPQSSAVAPLPDAAGDASPSGQGAPSTGPRRRWMVWTVVALGIAFVVVNLYLFGHFGFGERQQAVAAIVTTSTGAEPEPSISLPTTTTTRPTTTTTRRPSTTTTRPGPDDAEVVESLRRVAAAISASGGFTSIDLMTDRQVVDDVKALCVEIGGTGQGFIDRVEQFPRNENGKAELVLLVPKLTWASWYCPEHATQLKQQADAIGEAFAKQDQ